MKRLACLAALLMLALVLVPRASFAQIEPPSLSAHVQPRDVEVGEPFSVVLSVTVDASAPTPTEPMLGLPDGLRSSPPSLSTQTQISINNGHFSRRSGITATWQVVAGREGAFPIAGPTVLWNGRRLQANALRVVVHPATPGGRPRQVAPNPFDPFGMFPRLPGFFDTPAPEPEPEPPLDPELSLDAPLDSKIFLRSIVDQKTPVVGEQVTLTIYAYFRSSAPDITDPHEPSINDFLRREFPPPNTQPDVHVVSIGGLIWRVQTIFKVALFPLKSGELEIGPMQVSLGGPRSGPNPVTRSSQPLKLTVSEPPARGRPVGYQLGNVGNYSLAATVEPRRSEVGGALAVTLTLSGVGNVPNTVKIPEAANVEWLEPQVREDIDIENGKVRGSRTFKYVVRPKVAGTIELGDVTLPFWNPDRRVYDIARAYLGKIEVAPSTAPPESKAAEAPPDPWAPLGKPRERLAGYTHSAEPLTERPAYWFGLFGAPFAVVLTSIGSRGISRLRTRYAQRRKSAERGIDEALADARSGSNAGDARSSLGALERAIYLAIERATGIKARGVLIGDLPGVLAARGVAAESSTEITELLSAIEAARFDAGAAPAAASLLERALPIVRALGRMAPRAKV